MRAALLVLGAALVGYGGWLLVSRQHPAALLQVLGWLAAGVLLHDLVLAPLVAGLGRLWPRVPRTAAVAGTAVLVVLGPVTLVAIPVLGRFGARPDDPTLLPRDYTAGWFVVATVVVLGAVAAALAGNALGSGRAGRGRNGESSRRR